MSTTNPHQSPRELYPLWLHLDDATDEQQEALLWERFERQAWRAAPDDGACEHVSRDYVPDPTSPNGWSVFCWSGCGRLGHLDATNAEAANGPRAAALLRRLRGLQTLDEATKRRAYRWWTGQRVDACELLDLLRVTLDEARAFPASLWCPGAALRERRPEYVTELELATNAASYAVKQYRGNQAAIDAARAKRDELVAAAHAELRAEGWIVDDDLDQADAERDELAELMEQA